MKTLFQKTWLLDTIVRIAMVQLDPIIGAAILER